MSTPVWVVRRVSTSPLTGSGGLRVRTVTPCLPEGFPTTGHRPGFQGLPRQRPIVAGDDLLPPLPLRPRPISGPRTAEFRRGNGPNRDRQRHIQTAV